MASHLNSNPLSKPPIIQIHRGAAIGNIGNGVFGSYAKTYAEDPLSFSTSSGSDASTPSSKSLKYSTDSLSSFEDYRIGQNSQPDYMGSGAGVAPGTDYGSSSSSCKYVYVKCALPTSRDACTFSFITTMCCNCGRGGW